MTVPVNMKFVVGSIINLRSDKLQIVFLFSIIMFINSSGGYSLEAQDLKAPPPLDPQENINLNIKLNSEWIRELENTYESHLVSKSRVRSSISKITEIGKNHALYTHALKLDYNYCIQEANYGTALEIANKLMEHDPNNSNYENLREYAKLHVTPPSLNEWRKIVDRALLRKQFSDSELFNLIVGSCLLKDTKLIKHFISVNAFDKDVRLASLKGYLNYAVFNDNRKALSLFDRALSDGSGDCLQSFALRYRSQFWGLSGDSDKMIFDLALAVATDRDSSRNKFDSLTSFFSDPVIFFQKPIMSSILANAEHTTFEEDLNFERKSICLISALIKARYFEIAYDKVKQLEMFSTESIYPSILRYNLALAEGKQELAIKILETERLKANYHEFWDALLIENWIHNEQIYGANKEKALLIVKKRLNVVQSSQRWPLYEKLLSNDANRSYVLNQISKLRQFDLEKNVFIQDQMPYTWLLDPKSVVNWAPTKPYNSSKISIERDSNLLIEMSQEADYILGPWQKALDLAQERLDNPDVSDQDKYYALRCLIFTYIIYGHAGKYTEMQITKMLSELNPKLEQPSLVHYWYFNVFRGQKTDEALDFWKKFTISFKNYPQGHASYITALINSGHLSEADSLIRKIPAEHRDIIEIKLAEALYKIRTSKYGEAYNILKKVELEPKSLSCAKQHALYKCELCIKDKNYDGCLVECAYLLKLAYCDKQLIYISFKYAQEVFEMKGKNTLSYLTACQMLKIKENDSYAKVAIRNLVEKIKAQLH